MDVRIDGASSLLASFDSDFEIAHAGASAVVLRPDDASQDDLVITTGEAGLMPGGMHFPPEVFRAWHAAVRGTRVTFRVDARAMALIEHVDLRLPLLAVDADCLALAVGLLEGARRQDLGPTTVERAQDLARLALEGQDDELGRSVADLVGRGPGSTPAGDDLIVGVCAALCVAARQAQALRIAALACDLAHRTTRASRLYLRAAEQGRFAERVHLLAGALACPADTVRVMEAVPHWGASSGLDLAAGLLGGLLAARERSSSLAAPERPAGLAVPERPTSMAARSA